MHMPALSARLLGSLDVRAEHGDGDLPTAQKAQELLCYLLLHRGRPVRRGALSCVLWADTESRLCRKNLRQALWQLQSALGYSAADTVFDVAVETVTLRGSADLWLDVAEFQAAVEKVQGIPGRQLGTVGAAIADQAIQLYRGDLLEGFDFEWCLVEREWLQTRYLMLLDKLMSFCEANREYERGIEYGERILRRDRAREYTHRRLMCLHHLRGDRTGALRQYERCLQALDEEFNVAPAASTTRLREQICSEGGVALPSESRDPRNATTSPAAAAPGMHLRRLQHELADLQRQVGEEIRRLQPVLLKAASAVVAGQDAARPSGSGDDEPESAGRFAAGGQGKGHRTG